MSWIEHKYVSLLSSRLKNYKRKGPNLYNFSCIFCADLEAHPYQGRGYIYEKQGKLFYFCHYCNKTLGVANFIKAVDLSLFEEYNLERIKESGLSKDNSFKFEQKMKSPLFVKEGVLKGLKKISQLQYNDPAKVFIDKRKIPTNYHSKLFLCPNFYSWVNEIIPNKFSSEILKYDERRIIIPFFDIQKNVFAFQGRSLSNKSKVKYITIILDESKPKIFGLDTVDMSKDIILQESPFDSMFISNSIASAGGDLVSSVKNFSKERIIVCYDCERNSIQTINKIEKAIIHDYRVCIWPNNFEFKDVNEAIIGGLSSSIIENIIKENAFSGIRARLELSRWRRV